MTALAEQNRGGFTVGRLGFASDGTPRLGGHNPLKFLKYRKALAKLTGVTKVAFIFDSTGAGVTAPAQVNTGAVMSIPYQCAEILNARGIAASAENRFGCASGTVVAQLQIDGIRCSVPTGTWQETGTLVPGGNAFHATSGTWKFANYKRKANKCRITWTDTNSGRNVTYSVDSGAVTGTIAASNVFGIRQLVIDMSTVDFHNVAITFGTFGIEIQSVEMYDDTLPREIQFLNWGISGANSGQLADNSNAAPTLRRLALYQFHAPDLSIIEGGIINDWRSSIDPSVTKTNLTTLVTNALITGDAMLYTPRFDGGSTGNAANQELYVEAMRQVADEQGIGIFDGRMRMGSYAIGNAAGFFGDTVHGDQAGLGYGDDARYLISDFFAQF